MPVYYQQETFTCPSCNNSDSHNFKVTEKVTLEKSPSGYPSVKDTITVYTCSNCGLELRSDRPVPTVEEVKVTKRRTKNG